MNENWKETDNETDWYGGKSKRNWEKHEHEKI